MIGIEAAVRCDTWMTWVTLHERILNMWWTSLHVYMCCIYSICNLSNTASLSVFLRIRRRSSTYPSSITFAHEWLRIKTGHIIAHILTFGLLIMLSNGCGFFTMLPASWQILSVSHQNVSTLRRILCKSHTAHLLVSRVSLIPLGWWAVTMVT